MKTKEKLVNIVITGGLGFIGTNLVLYLLNVKSDICIRIVDNFSVGQIEHVESVYPVKQFDEWQYREQEWQVGVKLIKGDILNDYLANNVCKGADAVVHLAANTGVIPSIGYPRRDCLVNVLGTFNYLDACRKELVPRFVLASSSALLGNQVSPFFEGMCPKPISPYGASKLCGEAYCSAFNKSYNIQTICLRFSNVFGSYSLYKNSVVAKFIKQTILGKRPVVYGDGEQIRDFICVEDVCEAIWSSLIKKDTGGEVFQIGSGCPHSITELIGVLNELSLKWLKQPIFERYEPARVGEVLRSVSNVSRAERELNWKSKWKFEQALEKTFLWFMEEVK